MAIVIGWAPRRWRIPIDCARCEMPITRGVTHVNDRAKTPAAALCDYCFGLIRSGDLDPPPAAE